MGHRISHQHQTPVGTLWPKLDQEVAHGIAPPRQCKLLQQRNDLLADEALHLRLLLEALGLRAGMADEGPRPRDDLRDGNTQTILDLIDHHDAVPR